MFPVENGIKLQGLECVTSFKKQIHSIMKLTKIIFLFWLDMSLFYFIFLSGNFFIEFFTAINSMTLMVYSKFEIWDLVEKWILYFGRACYQFSDYYELFLSLFDILPPCSDFFCCCQIYFHFVLLINFSIHLKILLLISLFLKVS